MSDARRVPDLVLEQYALGELRAAERERVDAALDGDPALRERLEALRRSDAEILAERPPALVAEAIRAALGAGERQPSVGRPSVGGPAADGPSARRRLAAFPLGPVLAAAAAVLVLVGVLAFRGSLFPSADITRMKGGEAALLVYRSTGSGVEELGEGAAARAGDLLQLRYAPGAARYGAVFSIDGRGSVTFHLPAGYQGGAAESPALQPGGQALESAYELDDAPAFERFYLVTALSPFDLASLREAALALARSGADAPRLGEGLSWSAVTIRKKERSR